MSTPDAPRPARGLSLAFFGVAIVCAVAGGWYLTRDNPPEAVEGPIEIVAEQTAIAAGADLRVYWRIVPVGHVLGLDAPFVESFEVTTSAGDHGQGAVTGEQIFARVEQLELEGKLIQAWLRDMRPKVPITASASIPASVRVESGSDDYVKLVRLDAKGRSVMYLDLEVEPAPPEP